MKQRYWLWKRDGVYYLDDALTRKKESLKTGNREEAEKIRSARNAGSTTPALGAALARAYLTAYDQTMVKRTWADVMAEQTKHGRESSLWEIGASQTDAANLTHENIDWDRRVLTYQRQKLDLDSKPAVLSIGKTLEGILKQLPVKGPLFPHISTLKDTDRSAEFYRRCKLLGIRGVSLHSYRYAWAERARVAGIPQRWVSSEAHQSGQGYGQRCGGMPRCQGDGENDENGK